MIRFAVHRLALGLVVVVGVVVLTFVIARVIPGDPAVTYAGARASQEQLEQTRRELGLDKPAAEQLADYLKGVATGDWGTSYRTKRPVLNDLRTALPASMDALAGKRIRWSGKCPKNMRAKYAKQTTSNRQPVGTIFSLTFL